MPKQISKIMLIMPNFNWRVQTDVKKDPPMGVLYIASCLESLGYSVSVVDAHAEELTIDDVIAKIKQQQPQLVGISCNYAPLHNITTDLCGRIKSENKNIVTVVGGNHASASYRSLLKSCREIDYVVLGQGEYIFPSLIRSLNAPVQDGRGVSGVNGIAYIEDGVVFRTPGAPIINKLDELPMPAYHLVDMSKYDRYNVIISRGCPFQCNYCASNVITKHHVKYRAPKYVANEIKHLFTKYGNKPIWFSDDTFTANKKIVDELLDRIIDMNIGVEWSCLTRVNTTHIDVLKKMKKAGCKYISYGVESGNDEMLKLMNKKITIQNVEKVLEDTKSVGIDMYLFFIVGYPGDTKEMEDDSLKLIERLHPTGVGYNIFIPLPGTPSWKYLEEKGLVGFDTIEWDKLFARVSWDEHDDYTAKLASTWCNITPEDIIEICNKGTNMCK